MNRCDTDVRVEGVFVEENRTARKTGYEKSLSKHIMFDIIRCFLQGKSLPFPHNLFLKSVFFSTSGPRVPVVDVEPLLQK